VIIWWYLGAKSICNALRFVNVGNWNSRCQDAKSRSLVKGIAGEGPTIFEAYRIHFMSENTELGRVWGGLRQVRLRLSRHQLRETIGFTWPETYALGISLSQLERIPSTLASSLEERPSRRLGTSQTVISGLSLAGNIDQIPESTTTWKGQFTVVLTRNTLVNTSNLPWEQTVRLSKSGKRVFLKVVLRPHQWQAKSNRAPNLD